MPERINIETEGTESRVISYELMNLHPKSLYTLAVYQFEKKIPVIRQLVLNIGLQTPSKGKEVFTLSGLKTTKRGRRVYFDLYRQKNRVAPPDSSRESFDLVAFRDKNFLELLESTYVLYIGFTSSSKGAKTVGAKKPNPTAEEKEAYFQKWSELTSKQKGYCRCVLHVAAKNTSACNRGRKWGSGKCYNPYAVCGKSTKTSVRYCGIQYEWEQIPTHELHAFAQLHDMVTTDETTRLQLIKMLQTKSATV